MMNKRFLSFLFFLCIYASGAFSQATVQSLSETNDIISGDDQRRDYNKQLCALVKIQVVDGITDVEGNVMGDIINHGVEKWVYLAQGSRNMKIHLRNNLPITVMFRDYGINGLKSNRVYQLVIADNQAKPDVNREKKNNYVVFSVMPRNAIVYVDDNLYEPNADGLLSIYLPYGQHSYKIDATGGYESIKGFFEIGSEKVIKNITLKSQKAHICITTITPNTNIYVNDEYKGQNQWVQDTLPGTYKITAKLDGHRDWTSSVTLKKSDKKDVSIPALAPIFGSVNVDYAPIGSSVFIDSEFKGHTPLVISQLIIGKHKLEISKEGCETYRTSFNLPENKEILIMGELNNLKKVTTVSAANVPLVNTSSRTQEPVREEDSQVKAVDLGLSVKWASQNFSMINASIEQSSFFAWGESEPKRKYTIKNYSWANGTYDIMKDIGESISGSQYDVVRKTWGGKWRIPTMEEMRELMEKCQFRWEDNGITFIGPNGQTLFLPACGLKGNDNGYEYEGFYWTATQNENFEQMAYYLHFNMRKNKVELGKRARFYGLTIRPVTD